MTSIPWWGRATSVGICAAAVLVGAGCGGSDSKHGAATTGRQGGPNSAALRHQRVHALTHHRAPSMLFAHSARSAEATRHGGIYTIELSGAAPYAEYFLDRPGRAQGVVPTSRLFKGMFGKRDKDPPNATISGRDASRGGRVSVSGVTLLSGTYDG